MTFTEMCIPCVIVSDVKSSLMADLLAGVQCFVQKDFVYAYAYSEIIYSLNKPSQGLRSAQVLSEVVHGQKNIMSAGKFCSQWMGSQLSNLVHFITPLPSSQKGFCFNKITKHLLKCCMITPIAC